MRRTSAMVGAAAIAVSLLGPAPSAAAQNYFVPVSRALVVHGHGYGHGHGMSQYGAEGASRAGKTYREILAFYYPGTKFGRSPKRIRVLLTADTTSDVTVAPTRGLAVRDLHQRGRWELPLARGRDRWRIVPKPSRPSVSVVQFHDKDGWHGVKLGGRRVLRGSAEFVAPNPLRLVLPNGSTARYRGSLRAAVPFGGARVRETVNVLRMDDYVRGVVAEEMPASWSRAALRSQAVAARTYATFMQRMNRTRYYQVCDTTSCQVYGGVGSETDSTDRAVAKTARQILLHDGRPAFTQFSSSNGGWSAKGSAPYLAARRDPYDGWSGNPNHNWTTRIKVSSLESRYGEIGRLQNIRVSKRDGHGAWGGRVLQVILEGTRGNVALTGDDLRWTYGLKSTYFSFELTAIMRAWKRLGGRKSPLGQPTSAEERIRNDRGLAGAQQLFQRGRALWSQKTGARPLFGRILKRYKKMGDVDSTLGYPVSTILDAPSDGVKARFQLGMIYASAKTGAHELQGRVLRAYRDRNAATGPLGYPRTKVYNVKKGLRAKFQGGTITWLKARNKIVVDLNRS